MNVMVYIPLVADAVDEFYRLYRDHGADRPVVRGRLGTPDDAPRWQVGPVVYRTIDDAKAYPLLVRSDARYAVFEIDADWEAGTGDPPPAHLFPVGSRELTVDAAIVRRVFPGPVVEYPEVTRAPGGPG